MIKVKRKKHYATPILTKTGEEATIKKAATLQHDVKILTKIMTEDLIAREFRKHDKCYLSYTRISREPSDKQKEGEDYLYLFDTDRFEAACNIIEVNVPKIHQAVSMQLLNKTSGVGVGNRRYRYKLKERLIKKCTDSIIFITILTIKTHRLHSCCVKTFWLL